MRERAASPTAPPSITLADMSGAAAGMVTYAMRLSA